MDDKPTTERTALLANKAAAPERVVSFQELWQTGRKPWILAGVCGALVAGWASASTYVLYGSILDAMARATLVETNETLAAYVRLAVVELLATWLQFFAWSHAVPCVSTDAIQRRSSEVAGHVLYHAALGVTATVTSLRYGWDSLLVVVIVIAPLFLLMSSLVLSKAILTRTQGKNDTTEVEDRGKRFDEEVDALWYHARALRLMRATDVATDRVARLLEQQSKEYKWGIGMMAIAIQVLFFPVVVVLLYSTWKRQSTGGASSLVVFLASNIAIGSINKARTAYKKGDLDQLQRNGPTESDLPEDEHKRVQAAAWVRSVADLYADRASTQAMVSLLFATLYIAIALELGYSVFWMLQAPYVASASMDTALKLAVVVAASGAALGLAWDIRIRSQWTSLQGVRTTIFTTVFRARLCTTRDTDASSISAATLFTDSVMISMYAGYTLESTRLYSLALGAAGIAAAFCVDPWFAAAVSLSMPFEYLESGIQLQRGKSLYRCLGSGGGMKAWWLCLGESSVRALVGFTSSMVQIVLLYVQICLVASGTSSLLSTLSVLAVATICGGVTFVNRIVMGSLIKERAITAAIRLHATVLDQDSLRAVVGIAQDYKQQQQQRLAGDLVVKTELDSESASIRVRRGQLVVVPSSAEMAAETISSILEKRVPGVAVIGEIDVSTLSPSVVRDRILVLDRDPVRFPGSISENIHVSDRCASPEKIEQAAIAAGLDLKELHEPLRLEKWNSAEYAQLKECVLAARAIYQDPDVVLIEDFTDEDAPTAKFNLAKVVSDVISNLPMCKTVVFTDASATESQWQTPI